MTLWERIEDAVGGEFHEVIALVTRIRSVETSVRQLVRLGKVGAMPTDTPVINEIRKVRVALESIGSGAI